MPSPVATFLSSDFRLLLSAAKKQGVNPYCVYMGWNPSKDYEEVKDRGFEAVSAYAMGGGQATYTELVEATETRYWKDAARAGVPYVPLVNTGWDKNPRKDHPVSWEKGQPYHQQKVFPSRAKPEEIAAHLRRSLTFAREHAEICKAGTVIIYAWNEYDEGGWVAPTRGEDGSPDRSRLDAIREVLTDTGAREP